MGDKEKLEALRKSRNKLSFIVTQKAKIIPAVFLDEDLDENNRAYIVYIVTDNNLLLLRKMKDNVIRDSFIETIFLEDIFTVIDFEFIMDNNALLKEYEILNSTVIERLLNKPKP